MDIKTEGKEIDGKKYLVTPYTGRESLRISLMLTRLLAPAITLLIDSVSKTNANKSFSTMDLDDIDFGKVGDALMKLTSHMPEDEFIDFIMRMMKSTRINGTEMCNELFDITFACNITSLYKVLFFIIKVNYPDFFLKGESLLNIGSLHEQ